MSPADEAATAAVTHVLLTRFNLPTPGPESLIRAREGWLQTRWELFTTYTVPSVRAQTVQDFHWLVYVDTESPEWLLQGIAAHEAEGLYRPLYRTAVSAEDLRADIADVVGERRELLLTTNLDNDDGLARDFVARLQAAPRPAGSRQAVYLTNGVIRSGDRLYLRVDRNNAFCSVRETWDEPVTCWHDWHVLLGQHMPVVEVGGPPAWLQVVHGTNVSNRVHGRLVSPRGLHARFPGLLADVPEPSRSRVLLDAAVLAPARTARDAVRAGGKAVVMKVLGKGGLDRVKLVISRVRHRPVEAP
jgi:hypothetical protein